MSLFDTKLTPAEKITKAKISLYKETPFFSYLIGHLRLVPVSPDKLSTCGVDKASRLFYNPEFVDGLSPDVLKGVLVHEVMHLALRHPSREGGRRVVINNSMTLWNIACDIAVNNIVLKNNFTLPEESILPYNNSVTVFGITVENIDDKSSEEIYEELKAQLKKAASEGEAVMEGSGIEISESCPEGFDEHFWGSRSGEADGLDPDGGKDGEGDESGKEPKIGKDMSDADWRRAISEAFNHAKMIGKAPAGMELEIGELHSSKINWRAILRRCVASKVPNDFTWSRPNKRYIWGDIYLPSPYGEQIKVLVSIDTSGSIGREELTDFISEIVGISKSYPQVEFRILTHDVDVHDDVHLYNGNTQRVAGIQIHGGGGTSHVPLYNYIEAHRYDRDTKLLISFTDGYSDYPERAPRVETIFVLSGGHMPKEHMPSWGDVITIE